MADRRGIDRQRSATPPVPRACKRSGDADHPKRGRSQARDVSDIRGLKGRTREPAPEKQYERAAQDDPRIDTEQESTEADVAQPYLPPLRLQLAPRRDSNRHAAEHYGVGALATLVSCGRSLAASPEVPARRRSPS